MIKVLSFFPMKIASRATPEGLAGHGLSTTGGRLWTPVLVGLIRHAESLISSQWYVLVLTLRLAV